MSAPPSSPRRVRVGLVGCGNVSRQYLENLADSEDLEFWACADAYPPQAEALARRFSIPRVLTVAELIRHPEVELVLNLTTPASHSSISAAAIEAGKHVYTEKPLATDVSDARGLLAAAAARGVRVGCAPDTFLGPGLRRCVELIEDGAIGTPVSANAFLMTPGPEAFHPAPEFLYQEGSGPLFDGGPYYVSALVSLLGPVASVIGMSTRAHERRQILTGERTGSSFPVQTSTHVASLLRFARGAVATLVTSFDVPATRTPRLEIHGTTGSLICPAPNSWGGPAWVRTAGSTEFVEVPIDGGDGNRIGLGVAQMARALRRGEGPAASGERGLEILEIIAAIHDSAENRGTVIRLADRVGERTDHRAAS
ncbi:Gfo/Idh/MocA family protein [Microbacterium sp. P06]|uniref:Gfo/Idh/MocA family protein n=1 Tax=unclassified Microbacterium TaxID=2609290 RepID=UPI0037450254